MDHAMHLSEIAYQSVSNTYDATGTEPVLRGFIESPSNFDPVRLVLPTDPHPTILLAAA